MTERRQPEPTAATPPCPRPTGIAAHVDVLPLQDAVLVATREFVATTSYYRQRKESREAFERLAFALLDLRKAEDANT